MQMTLIQLIQQLTITYTPSNQGFNWDKHYWLGQSCTHLYV